MNSKVFLKRCDTYEPSNLKNCFEQLFIDFDKTKVKGKKILIFFDEPTPHEQVLDLAIKFLIDAGVSKITAGTSVFIHNIPDDILGMFRKNGVEFIDFRFDNFERLEVPFRKEKTPERSLGFAVLSPVQYASEKAANKMDCPNIRTLKNVLVPTAFTESDYIVPVLKMKDSPVFKIGGNVNSMLYFIPTITRSEVFVNFLKGHDTESVLEIFNIARNKALFGILDGIKTSISYDESVNSMNVLMFSEDLLSLDAMLSVLIGFRSSEVPTNELGNAFDFGNGILKRIDIYGDEFEKLRKEAIKNLRFASSLNRRKSSAPYINTMDANSIRIAMNFCPTGAIIEEDGNFSIDKNKCIKCNFCLEIANEIFKIS